jgi:hypothetical protein
MQPGDAVCMLSNCHFPVILHKVDEHYAYVGGCYVYGIYVYGVMGGEAAGMVNDGRVTVQELDIR